MYTSWGQSENTLKQIVLPTTGWDFLSLRGHETDRKHKCYGSQYPSTISTPARFKLKFHTNVCRDSARCGLAIDYVHSWNTYYIGSTLCHLYIADEETEAGSRSLAPFFPLEGYFINGNRLHQEELHDTTIHQHIVSNNVTGGEYILECRKLTPGSCRHSAEEYTPRSPASLAVADNLLSCFGQITLTSGA